MKVRLVIEGNVQGVSYRAFVKQIARRLGVKGLVRNLEERGVEIFCECSKEVLQNFVEMIDRKGDSKEVFSLNVEKINIYNEGEKGYMNPPEEFKIFDVDYKIKLDPFQKESIEKSEISGLLLVDTRDKVKDTRDEVKRSREDIKGVRDEVKGSREDIKETHQDMNKRFDWTAEKYGDIGTGIGSVKDDLKELKNIRNDVKEMKNLFAKLVNHIVKE